MIRLAQHEWAEIDVSCADFEFEVQLAEGALAAVTDFVEEVIVTDCFEACHVFARSNGIQLKRAIFTTEEAVGLAPPRLARRATRGSLNDLGRTKPIHFVRARDDEPPAQFYA